MYGSDWQMIKVKKGHEEYAKEYKSIYEENFTPNETANFLAKNALRFFGLDGSETQNRKRLLGFYKKYNMKIRPKWWAGNWWA